MCKHTCIPSNPGLVLSQVLPKPQVCFAPCRRNDTAQVTRHIPNKDIFVFATGYRKLLVNYFKKYQVGVTVAITVPNVK